MMKAHPPAAEATEAQADLAARVAALARLDLVAPTKAGIGPLFSALQPLIRRLGISPPPGAAPLVATHAQLRLLERPELGSEELLDLPEPVLARLRAGEGFVAFDTSTEGRPFSLRHVQAMHGALERAGLPPSRAGWLQQNRDIAPYYRSYCAEQGIAPMRVLTADAFGFGLWRRLAGAQPRPVCWPFGFALAPGPRRYRWICLNYMLRPHRALLATWLMERPEPGHLSFSTRRPVTDVSARPILLNAVRRLSRGDEAAVARVAALLEEGLHLGGDTDGFANAFERVYSLPEQEVAAAELFIVTETEMASPGLGRWTEKTLKALATGLPIIVFGNLGTVAALAALGFDMLDDLVDHGYDAVAAPEDRFAAARVSVARFLARPPGFTEAEMRRLRAASAHNREVFAREILRVAALDPLDAVLAAVDGG
ncbi:hypothetical protein [Neoroseomonas soli]|uniref:Uncharacterized protein n=1 Tax=Neoroseomonas soli TaxID=1081025 RepID=A0A9X9WU50_9PROT|nr:hypothetical protein [Neoroseomonas soli]MBR0670679.1 hypothetical protein [Neoroseomonas soli]